MSRSCSIYSSRSRHLLQKPTLQCLPSIKQQTDTVSDWPVNKGENTATKEKHIVETENRAASFKYLTSIGPEVKIFSDVLEHKNNLNVLVCLIYVMFNCKVLFFLLHMCQIQYKWVTAVFPFHNFLVTAKRFRLRCCCISVSLCCCFCCEGLPQMGQKSLCTCPSLNNHGTPY